VGKEMDSGLGAEGKRQDKRQKEKDKRKIFNKVKSINSSYKRPLQ
jgi:hypothetical protein